MIHEQIANQPNRLFLRARLMIGAGLLLTSALAWVISLQQVGEMAMMPASPVGALVFVGIWTVMMAAIMLPSELPATLLFAAVAQSRTQFGFRPVPTVSFVAGYLVVWALIGIGVALLNVVTDPVTEAWSHSIVGSALIIAGVYQLTRWKSFCLGHCRTPLHFFMDHWRDGVTGALRMGAHHGLYCVGCCWGLMLALIVLGLALSRADGMMNPAWMASIALLIFVEKVVPGGERLARFAGVGLIFAGAAVAFGLIPLQQSMTMEGM